MGLQSLRHFFQKCHLPLHKGGCSFYFNGMGFSPHPSKPSVLPPSPKGRLCPPGQLLIPLPSFCSGKNPPSPLGNADKKIRPVNRTDLLFSVFFFPGALQKTRLGLRNIPLQERRKQPPACGYRESRKDLQGFRRNRLSGRKHRR